MKITIVVAMAETGAIGNNNQLLCHLPNDLKHFKAITMGKPIVMGRKTYESIGKPLPGRQNIILSHQKIDIPGCTIVHSVQEAIRAANNAEELMVIGGSEIYRLFFPLVNTMHITYIHAPLAGNISFVPFAKDEWQEISRERYSKDENHAYDYSFVTLVRA